MALIFGGSGGFSGGTVAAPVFVNVDDDANAALKVKNAGDGNAFQVDSHANAGVLQIFHFGSLFSRPESGGVPIFIQPRDTSVPAIQIRGMTAAPPDGSLQANDITYWLDPTPGAARVMFKAKDSAGTVVTAAVSLT